ncbi:MAG: hypothetical protein WBA74_21905, partial [Cyclobacteriaceae bacterium]
YTILSREKIEISWKDNNLSAITTDKPIRTDCLDLADSGNKIAVFDRQNRLRGIYDVSREETDRLILEIDILMRYE